jgi:hypothetical protein
MALPSSGPISMADMNTDRGISATTQIDLASAGSAYGVSYTTNGSNDLQFFEFYGLSTTPTFTFGNWNGSVSVSQGGTVSYVTGNAAAVSVSPTSYGIVNTDTNRTISVTVTVPSGYTNSGGTVSGTKTVTQSLTPTFTFGDAGVSGFSVGQDGTIYAPSVSAGTISSITYVNSNGNTSYSPVDSNTTRTATVSVTVPIGYYNSGGTVSGDTTATQPAAANEIAYYALSTNCGQFTVTYRTGTVQTANKVQIQTSTDNSTWTTAQEWTTGVTSNTNFATTITGVGTGVTVYIRARLLNGASVLTTISSNTYYNPGPPSNSGLTVSLAGSGCQASLSFDAAVSYWTIYSTNSAGSVGSYNFVVSGTGDTTYTFDGPTYFVVVWYRSSSGCVSSESTSTVYRLTSGMC